MRLCPKSKHIKCNWLVIALESGRLYVKGKHIIPQSDYKHGTAHINWSVRLKTHQGY